MNSELIYNRSHTVACWLVVLAVVGMFISPPIANLAELLVLLLILSSSDLRQKLWQTGKQPVVRWLLLFYVIIIAGLFYSIAAPGVATSMATGWRKLLLLPLALALFDDSRWKYRFLIAFTAVMAIFAIVSFVLLLLHIDIYAVPGVFLRNHSTQSMVFAVGAFSAAILAIENKWKKFRPLFIIEALLMLSNVILVASGRSGYLVLLICTAVGILGWMLNKRRLGLKELALSGLLVLMVVGGLFLAPSSRDRIAQAVREVQQYDQATEVTSMGIRIIFWKNTVEMIAARPLLGYGTGAFGEAYGQKVAGRTGVAGTPAADPHNQYMKIAGEHGLLGLGVFLCFLVSALRSRVEWPWKILSTGVVLAWCATGLANSHFSTFTEGSFVFTWMGIMLGGMGRPGGTQAEV